MTDQKTLSTDRMRRANYGARAYESGANPDFRPSRMTDTELQLRKLMGKVSEQSQGLARRMKALEAHEKRLSERHPKADPVPEPVETAPVEQPDATATEEATE